MMPMMISSDTSWPLSMASFARRPTSVPAFTAARSMSPVLRCTTPKSSRMRSHCVPLPEAGAPAMMILSGMLASDTACVLLLF